MKRFLKHFLSKKTGVTVLEGLIALGLLALVAGGTFGVLLSVSRKAGTPDIREEMALAVERANELLPMYAPLKSDGTNMASLKLPNRYQRGLCEEINDPSPMSLDSHHDIRCLLPPICDESNSSFSYEVGNDEVSLPSDVPGDTKYYYPSQPHRQITFKITCNGFSL